MFKTLAFLLIISLMIGCAGYKFQEVETALKTGKPGTAYTYLQKHAPKKSDIPFLFELGVVAHYANEFAASSTAFDQAADIAEDRYTKSVSKEVGSLVTSDKLIPYTSAQYERLLIHYYRAFNYIYQDQLDSALVECRRATSLINYFKGEDEKYDFFGAAFLAYLSGTLFEAAGEFNDAFISYRQAAAYYQNAMEKTGVQMPDVLGYSLVRLARMGFADDPERYVDQYGEPPSRPKNTGELVLVYETGYVPRKREENLVFPILKTDKVDDDEFVPTLIKRRGKVYEDTQLEYLLRVAIPSIHTNRPHYRGIEVAVDTEKAKGQLVEDVEKLAIETLNAQSLIVLGKTLVRALTKYLLFRQANKQHEALGLLTNLAGVLTEQADTRSWKTLPNQIFMVRMSLPEGTHTLNLSFLGENGGVRGRDSVPDIQINPNRITFLNYRTYQ